MSAGVAKTEPVPTESCVRTLSGPADLERWDDFVRSSPGGTFYHLAGWKTIIETQLGHTAHYLLFENNSRIEGILPLVHVKSWLFGNSLISVPFLVYGGPVTATDGALQELLTAATSLAEELGVDYLELRNEEPLEGDWHTKTSYVTFRKALDPDSDANLKAIPRKQRAMIRKGIKFGLEAEQDSDARRLYRVLLECKRNLGTPFFGESWLQAIKEQFRDAAEILTVTHNGAAVCSVMSFRFRDQILPYYGGGGTAARDLKGNDFMYWAVMEKACADGVKIFDYGRSSAGSGAYRFKKHWGFEPQPLHYQYHLVCAKEMPNLNPSNPKYRLLIRGWQKLPLTVANVVGPAIASKLG